MGKWSNEVGRCKNMALNKNPGYEKTYGVFTEDGDEYKVVLSGNNDGHFQFNNLDTLKYKLADVTKKFQATIEREFKRFEMYEFQISSFGEGLFDTEVITMYFECFDRKYSSENDEYDEEEYGGYISTPIVRLEYDTETGYLGCSSNIAKAVSPLKGFSTERMVSNSISKIVDSLKELLSTEWTKGYGSLMSIQTPGFDDEAPGRVG